MSNALSPAVFQVAPFAVRFLRCCNRPWLLRVSELWQNKFVVVISSSEVRVASYGYVGGPAVGDRPDRKSTPFCLKILSVDLLQPPENGKMSGTYSSSPTAQEHMDAGAHAAGLPLASAGRESLRQLSETQRFTGRGGRQ
jgi:hypothetical protein